MVQAGDVPFHDIDQSTETAGTPQKRDSGSAPCLGSADFVE
jgi:hypothetical protein